MAGVSRSSAIAMGKNTLICLSRPVHRFLCLAYLIKYRKWTLRRAYKHILKIREVIRPNSNFLRQLVTYEREYVGTSSTEMVKATRGGITVLVPDWMQHDLPANFASEFEHNREMNRVLEKEERDTNAPTAPTVAQVITFSPKSSASGGSGSLSSKSSSSKSPSSKSSNSPPNPSAIKSAIGPASSTASIATNESPPPPVQPTPPKPSKATTSPPPKLGGSSPQSEMSSASSMSVSSSSIEEDEPEKLAVKSTLPTNSPKGKQKHHSPKR